MQTYTCFYLLYFIYAGVITFLTSFLSFHLCSLHLFNGAAGGHYIAYCQNVINGQWYEFDDQYVTEVHETVVQNAEAYVLFYR